MKYIYSTFFPVIVTAFFSCSGGGSSPQDKKADDNSDAISTGAENNTNVSCNGTNAIDVIPIDQKSDYARLHKEIEWKIRDTKAFRTEEKSLTTYTIFLANFDFNPATLEEAKKVKPGKGEAMIRIIVNYYEEGSGETGLPLPPGIYDVNNEKSKNYQQAGLVSIITKDGADFAFTMGKTQGTLEIVKADDKEICGKINLEDPVFSVKTDFVAPVK